MWGKRVGHDSRLFRRASPRTAPEQSQYSLICCLTHRGVLVMAQIQELSTEYTDRIGMVTSALCFIHCVAAPVVLSLSVVSSHFIPSEERTHRLLAVFVTIVGTAAIGFGYKRHKRKRVLGAASLICFSRERSCCDARGQLLHDLRSSGESHVLQRDCKRCP